MLPFPCLLLAMAASISLLSTLLSPPPLAAAAPQLQSVYDVLKQYGLPMGILPKGVKDFRVDGEGRFEVRLEKPCTASFENQVHYEANVSGTINYGRIGGLKGVSAQELFLWFPVKGIRVDVPSSGLIYFDVGVIYKQFSLSLFETPPDCHPVDKARDGLLREGEDIANVVSESKSGKLRYMLDSRVMEQAPL